MTFGEPENEQEMALSIDLSGKAGLEVNADGIKAGIEGDLVIEDEPSFVIDTPDVDIKGGYLGNQEPEPDVGGEDDGASGFDDSSTDFA